MIKKVNNISDIQIKILALFTKGFNKDYYIREMQKLLKISSRTALINLNFLEEKNILKSKFRGKIKLYKLNPSFTTNEYIKFAEIYKKIQFFEKNILIKDAIERIEDNISGIALIFGSYAKGLEKKDSDLDIFILGSYKSEKIDEISKILRIKINVKRYDTTISIKDLKSDILFNEVLENHIIIKGLDEFIVGVMK